MGASSSNSKKLQDNRFINSTKKALIFILKQTKNKSISLTKNFLENDDQIFKIANGKIDELDNLIDICNKPNNPNKENKNLSLDLDNIKKDKLDKDIFNQLKEYKKTLEDSYIIFEELLLTCGKKMKEIKTSFEDIKTEISNTNKKYKEVLKILLKPLSYINEEFDINKFGNKKFKETDIDECIFLIQQLQEDFDCYVSLIKGFINNILYHNNMFIDLNDDFYDLIKNKLFVKIKEILALINEGIILIEKKLERINTFNNDIKTKKISTKEHQKFVDNIKDEVLKKLKSIDNQIYNSYNSFIFYFDDSKGYDFGFEKGNDILKKGESSIKVFWIKVIDDIEKIMKFFDKKPLKIDYNKNNIEFPFYEYIPKFNKGCEIVLEIKEEFQKSMISVINSFEKQIKMETLDLLIIMCTTISMQDILDEFRNSINYISEKIKGECPGIEIRYAFEGFRDFEDIKEGGKYYTIDFEVDIDVFKKKLEEIVAKGVRFHTQDVSGGLDFGYYMSWRSNARYAILLTDSPEHGRQYHDNYILDDIPERDPDKLTLEDIMKNYVKKNINLCLTRIDYSTNKMFKIMIFEYNQESQKSKEKPKIQQLNFEKKKEEHQPYNNIKKNNKKKENQIDGKKFTPTTNLGDLISKSAAEIYKQYSKKNN